MARRVRKDALPHCGTSHRFEGAEYGNVGVSFFLTDAPMGAGPGLHIHPYAEIFIVQEGRATFTVGEERIEAGAGQIVIVPPGAPHAFVNAGDGPLRQISIHPRERMITEWLED